MLSNRARDVFEKVNNIIPEYFIVEVTVYGTPR
jgi:hypothetical protein